MAGARALTLDLLLRAEAAGQYGDRALGAALERSALSPADKSFVTALFYGVTERRVTLDAIIDDRAKLAPSAIETRVRTILRMGLYQLLYMDRVPDHAAIDEAVTLTPRRSKGFVNALLRGFCRDGKVIPVPPADAPAARRFSVAYAVPVPLAERFIGIFGEVRAARILEAFTHHPPHTVRVNTLRESRDGFLSSVPGSVPTPHAPHGVMLPPDAPLLDLVRQGRCFVQDEASQIAVAALGAGPCERVLDLCAAPGSKSFGAALDMGDRGEVRSFDLHENKISLIRDGASRLGLSCIRADAADARAADPSKLGMFDRVLCDVPCSGLGVLWKKPDVRFKDLDAAAGLLPVQAAILDAGAACVRPGGRLVYSTCTLLPEENEEQVRRFLAAHPDFAPVPFAVGDLATDGLLTLAPDTHGTDGFFVAVLGKGE